ncbi:P24 [Plodia interpunctella granulovirus]|uniref:p24 n=1 Tax=Plodia interpunctella granulovirus TaxID=262175 RepID=A0A1L5JGM7_9BBAC|nr:P24 [Plodia interpunctella granulovirus]APO13942.1 P24 [Plodia interpunctella granulovirus]
MSFEYHSGPIEVFVVTNDGGGVNGFAEVTAVTQLLSPYTRISSAQLWNTTNNSYKIQNNGKNFIHAIAICKFLSSIPESDSASYKNLRQLVRDLMVGDQKEIEDEVKRELDEIKNSLAECKTELGQYKNILSGFQDNILSDFSGLLRVLKSELINEISGGGSEV